MNSHSVEIPRLGKLGFGGAGIGNLYRAIPDGEALATVLAAWDAGIRYFDTAPHYGLGLSEQRLGAVLRDKPRNEFVVSTKVGRLLEPTPHGGRDPEGFDVPADKKRVWDFSEAGIRRSLEDSLERLGLLAGRYTLLEQPNVPLLDRCLERRTGVVNVGVYNSGLLARPEVPDDAHYNYDQAPRPVVERARKLAAVCRRFANAARMEEPVPEELWAALEAMPRD